MMEDWKQAWRDAVENFRRELHGDDGVERHGPALGAMRDELERARDELRRLEDALRRASARLEEERRAEEACRRRAAMARQIGDDETERVATGFGHRHGRYRAVLTKKVEVLEEERELRVRDVRMMEELVQHARGAADAAADPFRHLEQQAREQAADARLEELKRRMG